MVLQLRRVHPVRILLVVGRVLVQVGHEDRLAVRGLDMLARASVAVAARANLEVEGAIDLVLLRAENRGQEVRHDCFLSVAKFFFAVVQG